MTKAKLIMMLGIVLLTVGCRKEDGSSEECPPPVGSYLPLNKEYIAFGRVGGEEVVYNEGGKQLLFAEVQSKIEGQEALIHPLGEGYFPYVPYSVIDGGWFRLELENEGKTIRCIVERNDGREERFVNVWVTGEDPTECGYFEVVQSGVE